MEITRNDLSIDISAIYKNHPLSANSTRVLRLLPPTFSDLSDVISCQLSVISLDNRPGYRAVSYVWGDPSETKIIMVDNTPFLVRINLWNFLAQMRAERYWDALWIDAICINQDNLEERRNQVTIMGQIYSEAADTRAWLGVGTETYLLAMQRLANTNWPTREHVFSKCQPLWNESFATDDWFAPVLDLLNHEYWSRIWIIQEYSLATNLAIQCGSSIVPTATLEVLLFWIAFPVSGVREKLNKSDRDQRSIVTANLSTAYVESLLSSRASNILIIKMLVRTYGSYYETLAWLLFRSRRSKCTDLHDGVYALLSLSGVLSANIVPDYTKSMLQIFLEVTAILKEGRKAADNASEREVIFSAVVSLPERLQLDVECVEVQEVLDYFHNPYSG